jgi:hypothetical protein
VGLERSASRRIACKAGYAASPEELGANEAMNKEKFMKIRRLLLAVLVCLSLLVPAQAVTAPKPYTSPDGKFSIAFPNKPIIKTGVRKIDSVTVTVTDYSVVTNKGMRYRVLVNQFPENFASEEELVWASFLAIQHIKGITFNGKPFMGYDGRHPIIGAVFVVPSNTGLTQTAMLITASDSAVYIISFSVPKEKVNNITAEAVGDFLLSFKLKE